MLKYYLLSLFILCTIIINKNYAITLISSQITSQTNYAFIPIYNQPNICSATIICIFSDSTILNITDFRSVGQKLVASKISSKDVTNQIFQINITAPIGIYPISFSVQNQNFTLNNFECKDPYDILSFEVTKVSQAYFNPSTMIMTIPITMSFNIFQTMIPIKCNINGHFCESYPLGGFNNEYLLQIWKYPTFAIYNELDITISNIYNGSQKVNFQVDSLFPFSVTSPADFGTTEQFPPSNSVITIDQLYQKYNSLAIYSARNISSTLIYEQSPVNYWANWRLVQSNGTYIKYMARSFLARSSNNIFTVYSDTLNNQLAKVQNTKLFMKKPISGYLYSGYSKKTWYPYGLEYNTYTFLNNLTDGQFIFPVLELPFGYPFGYQALGSDNKYLWTIAFFVSLYSQGEFDYRYRINGDDIDDRHTSWRITTVTNSSSVEINNMTIIPLDSFSVLVEIGFTSYYKIIKMNYCGRDIKGYNLISGDRNEGVVQLVYTYSIDQPLLLSPYLKVYDETSVGGPLTTYMAGQYINSKLHYFTEINADLYPYIESSQFLDFKFRFNNLVLQKNYTPNVLTFKLATPYPDFKPILIVGDRELIDKEYQNKHLQFIGSFNSTSEKYSIVFNIPDSFTTGPMMYYLVTPYRTFNSTILASLIGRSAILNITQSNGDMLSPIVRKLSAVPSNNVSFDLGPDVRIGWNITIEDYPNGFLYGNISVVSESDLEPRNFIINSTHRIEGDSYYGVYYFDFNVNSNCRSQAYFISKLDLYDAGNVKLNPNFMSRLSTIVGGPYDDQFNINVTCPDFNPGGFPSVTNFSITPIVDVGKRERIVNINMTVVDGSGYGISNKTNPTVYLVSNPESVQIQTKLISGDGFKNQYSASFQMPYGIGTDEFLISIFGLVDNKQNINGYTLIEMRMNLTTFYIQRNFTLNQDPMLLSHTPFTLDGGVIFVTGYSLGSYSPDIPVKSEIDYGSGYQPINITNRLGSVIEISVGSFRDIGIESAKFRVQVNDSLYSNEIDLIPLKEIPVPPEPTETPTITPTPTVTPTTSPTDDCNPKCSQYGVCQNKQCICTGKYFGPSCSSEIFPIPPPLPEPEPSTTINYDHDINITISIVEINELGPDLSIVKQYNLRNNTWKFKDLSTKEGETVYHYTSNLPGRVGTMINTTLEYFPNETTIQFAGKNLTMQSSSIKFTSSLSNYEFDTKVNVLDVIFEASINSNSSDACSSRLNGSMSDGSQYIKININDVSLFGSFIDVALLDGRPYEIENIIILNQNDNNNNTDDNDLNPTPQHSSFKVAVRIPFYEDTVIIDPNFSVLVDVAEDNTPKLCQPGKNKKLSNGAIAGIVVGGIVLISVATAAVIFYKKQYRHNKQIKMINNKMKNLN